MANPVHPRPSSRTHVLATISTAADGLSDVINLTGLTLSSIQCATAWTAATIGFKANVDGSTDYFDVYGSTGDLLTFQAGANRVLRFDPAFFAGIQHLQLISETTAGSPVAQAASRVIKLGLAP